MSINLPLYIVRRRLNVLQNGLVTMVLLTFDTCLKDPTSIRTQYHA